MKLIFSDLETYQEMFLCICYDPQEDEWHRFEVSAWKNELDALIKYIEEYEEYYLVFYNGIRFDSQVLEFIIRNHHLWIDKTKLEICAIIAQVATDVINDSNYNVFPQYKESNLSFKLIDPYEIAHYSNKNRMVSLKRLEFEMDLEDIEETPVNFKKIGLTRKECVEIINYCRNDVFALYKFYQTLTGNTEHPLYKDNDQIELRLHIEEEFGINCLNYSNSKIGDEIIKKYYCEETHIGYSALPKKGTFRTYIALKNCIPSYVEFKTPQLQNFLKRVKKTTLSQKQDFVESIQFYGQTYTFAKGGLHNVINGKVYESDDENDIEDEDVAGYYPATIINNSYSPKHLGKPFLTGYTKVYMKRIPLKPLAKKDKKIKGIVTALKDAGNCPYGKSSDMSSWLFDKQMTLQTCLTGEFSLLMLIEAMELKGFRCIMANTDGATFIVPKAKRELYEQIKNEWLVKTTKVLRYELEQTHFKKLIFSTVNDYIGIKTDGEVKLKGDFMKDFELHKNKSARIVPLALEKYYVEGIPVEQTIMQHTNIYDFAIRQKASKFFHYEGIDHGTTHVYDKLIRYYVSNTGEKLLKIKNPECQTRAAKVSQVNAGEWLMTVCNRLRPDHPLTNINYQYYIEKANRIIHKIQTGGKKYKPVDKNQLSFDFLS